MAGSSRDQAWKRYIGTPKGEREKDDGENDDDLSPCQLPLEELKPPQWDGDPESWEHFQQLATVFLMEKQQRALEEKPPQWDGDPDTLDDFQEAARTWAASRQDLPEPRSRSSMKSGRTTPASSQK